MKWAELIIVRAADSECRPIVRRLVDQLMHSGRPDGITTVKLYRNAFVESDIGIHLEWFRECDQATKSDIGIALVAALEEFGRVHHTIWIDDGGPDANQALSL